MEKKINLTPEYWFMVLPRKNISKLLLHLINVLISHKKIYLGRPTPVKRAMISIELNIYTPAKLLVHLASCYL